ncbi:unnamed protein product [Mycena citricolor]|uniref:Structural maintenance of chromosomes protein 5 n=1 Tax=Mycena citricolor TaxID=2018698 RepID=A0AAD2HCG0_9AGAR|nr:unnamed protein product [Mycena citricolor]
MAKRVESSEDGDMNSSPEPARVKGGKTRPSGKGKARDEETSPRGAKRARVNDAGDSAHREDEDEDDGEVEPSEGADEEQAVDDDDDEAPPSRVRVKTLPRDVDGYIPGSIVRINLRNFVTYDAVEFCPGPYLNMILGPNGTGKSSIACAICLGLNWSPAILGRANDLNEFVKINTQEGHIEIELKGPAGEPNLVIRRNITSRAKSSTFTLNGKAATGGEVSAKVAKLNVQVGNLCSFLPQDKVSSFAAMSPVELLRETENAAGDERLKSWHDTLNDAGKELKLVSTTITEETTTMETMKTRNEGIQRDVQRYRERKKIEHEVDTI